jgi:DNA-binding XRE family transcriptional regulator
MLTSRGEARSPARVGMPGRSAAVERNAHYPGAVMVQDVWSWDTSSLDSNAWDVWGWAAMTAQPLSPATRAFGERVRARRHELGLSQEQLAQACGLHWTFVGQVERGRRNVSLHNILKLAAGLQADAGHLVRGLHAPDQ